MILSDQELIEKAKSGDKQAFAELYDRYKRRILSYLYRYVGNYQTAEDLTIETFLNAYKSIDRYEERGAFSAWLYSIATDCGKNEFRRLKRHNEVSLEKPVEGGTDDLNLEDIIADESTRPDFEARKNELKDSIYKIVAKMDKKYKDVLLLCDVEELGYEEAAKILNCNHITVGTRLKRARQMLYDILKKQGYQL